MRCGEENRVVLVAFLAVVAVSGAGHRPNAANAAGLLATDGGFAGMQIKEHDVT